MRSGALISGASVTLALLVWEGICRAGLVSPVLLSPPSRVAVVGAELVASGALTEDLLFTAGVFALSMVIAAAVGLSLGFLMGASRVAWHALNPFVVVANSLPKVVLMPLVLLWLGISVSANVFLGSLMASFPILINVAGGVRGMDVELMNLARAFRAGRWLTVRAVVLPAVTPHALAGLRVGVSYGMVGVLIAEFFGANRGTGHRMLVYIANFHVAEFFVCVVLVAAFTLACVGVVALLERRVEAWRPSAF